MKLKSPSEFLNFYDHFKTKNSDNFPCQEFCLKFENRYKPSNPQVKTTSKVGKKKFINKPSKASQPNFLKETTGSKTKKMYSREKASRIRTTSRNKKIILAQEKLGQKSLLMKDSPVTNKQLEDITKLADEFWDQLETEKMKISIKMSEHPASPHYESNTKSSSKKSPEKVPIFEKTTFSTQMKNDQVRGSVERFKNKQFYDKFRHSNYNRV